MTFPFRPARVLPLAAIAVLLGGCSLVPAYERPQVDLAPRWNSYQTAPLGATVPVRSGWWRSFGDPVLSALEDRALRDSQTLAQARARIEQARGAAQSAGAPLYPTVTLNGTLDRVHNASGTTAKVGSGSSSNTQSLFAQAGYELDFWGKNRAAGDAAQALAQASVYDADTVALTLTASVADTYFQLLSLRERLRLAQGIADDARRLLALVQSQADLGVASSLQVEQQRSATATFAAALPPLQQQLEQNSHLLAVLVGATPEQFALADGGVQAVAVPQPQAGLPASILRRRPDIRAAEARLQAANVDIGAARAAFYPSLALTANAGVTSAALGHLLSSNPILDIGAALAQTLFDGGQRQGQLTVSRGRATELAAAYRGTVLGALQEVEDGLSATVHQRELEAAAQAAASSAQRASTLAEAQYRLGSSDFLNVLTAQRTRSQAQDALLQARLGRLQAAVGLFRTLGGGFDAASETHSIASISGATP
ncbi:efflux transporter outer membrane subunit [Janthinobacterium sp. P210006]|uniref:efflux transporter outer membrane subunit n=1 Tax=Janthinobacterium sp. P210006 TaxID=3112939 RepID=UPI002E268665|nr:efflux transporter outer membrane subunit [Janthinobacterium sp. P210006]